MSLVLKQVCLPLAEFTLEVNLELRSPITVLFGPSGSGKTSLLDTVAGLRRPSSGFIKSGDSVLTDTEAGIFVPSRLRGIGYLPQELALFPHLSVRQNLLYGNATHSEKRFGFAHIADLLKIEPLLSRSILHLSGGERQRVALGRALLSSPRLLLLDEPLANLDGPLKMEILPYLSRVWEEFGIPMLYVTHDQNETLALANEIAVLIRGRIAQTGPVDEVFNHPVNLGVAAVTNMETVQRGRITGSSGGLVTVTVGKVELKAVEDEMIAQSREVYVCIRANDVTITKGSHAPSSARNHFECTVLEISSEGSLVRVELDCGFALSASLTRQAIEELDLKRGDKVSSLVKAPNVHLIARSDS